MLRYLLLALLFVCLYKFIIRVVLPVLRVTTTVRRQMQQMQDANNHSGTAARQAGKPKSGEYIEFEEVR